MLTDKDKIDIICDKISGLKNTILELENRVKDVDIDPTQIEFIDIKIKDLKKSLILFKGLLQEIDPNVII